MKLVAKPSNGRARQVGVWINGLVGDHRYEVWAEIAPATNCVQVSLAFSSLGGKNFGYKLVASLVRRFA